LAIGIHELASISERRVDRMCNPPSNGGELPAFLVKEKGLCSGYMIAQYTAASLVSEDKVLCHPASVDSITVSANQEDHDSMGGFSARKAVRVVEHVEQVLAVELLCACQAMDLHGHEKPSSPAIEKVRKLIREHVPYYAKDRHMSKDMDTIHDLVKSGKIVECIKEWLE
ncbi:Aromatic amino acid lyase like protein, partial [Aduncisulcus paluster]